GNVYLRRYRNVNLSSNVNGDFGKTDPDTGVVQANEATNDRSTIDQKGWGFGLQLTLQGAPAGMKNQFIAGASCDFGDTTFSQISQPANFTANREAIAIGDFAPETDVGTRNRYLGAFLVDTLALSEQWTLTVAGRYNHARITVADRSGAEPALDSASNFSRFN